ncbi:hypothetical protein chiPu_0011589 [Chiloscyllium punctatum]|uniref:Uncharacterized protein n=1 Tax=Chiloscyllium punctatum TaxID=137246 RepID=A0A401SRX8_CHIPU|nr:hypothetical protein [Chiloscyllium punctatum]
MFGSGNSGRKKREETRLPPSTNKDGVATRQSNLIFLTSPHPYPYYHYVNRLRAEFTTDIYQLFITFQNFYTSPN